MTSRQARPLAGWRLITMWTLGALALGALGGPAVFTQGRQGGARAAAPWPPKLEAPAPGTVAVLPVQGQTYMLVGAGANITVQAGDAGGMVVDTGTAAMSEKVIAAMVEGLNRLIELTVPEANAGGGTLVVPGRGRIADHAEVAYYRDMITIIRDRLQDGIAKNLTLAQIKAARPTRDYDARYGKTTGPWTTDMFVEAAYASLIKK